MNAELLQNLTTAPAPATESIQKPRKKLTDRLELLNDGRPHYLEFLRNLTPQIILLSLALYLMNRLDLSRFDLANSGPTFLFLLFFGAFALAFYANTTLFYERCFSQWRVWLKETQDSLVAQGLTRLKISSAIYLAIWRERFVEVMEVIAVLIFLQVALAAVVVMSAHSASSMWRAIHAKEIDHVANTERNVKSAAAVSLKH